MAVKKVMLVDDHAVLRGGLRLLVNAQPDMEVTAEAGALGEALRILPDARPDLVLLDLSLPDGNGLDAIGQMKAALPSVIILVLTMHEDVGYLKKALAEGADGYISKRAADADLLRAIRQVTQGQVFIAPELTRSMVDDLLRQPAQVPAGAPEALSEREKEVLRLVALGYTNQEVADRLVISVKTVENHKAHIKEKLGLRTRAEMVRYCLRQGWLPEAAD